MQTFKLLYILLFLFVLSCIPKPEVVYIPRDTDSEQALFSKAENFFYSRNHEKAIIAYREYLARFPDSKLIPAALMRMSTLYGTLGQNESARNSYMRIIRNYPNSNFTPDAIINVLESYLNEGLFREVIYFFDSLPRGSIPDSYISKIYVLIGDAQMRLKLPADAAESYLMASTKSSDSGLERIDKKLRDSISQLEIDSIALLAENIKEDTAKGYFKYQLGLNYFEKHKYREAADVLNDFIKTIPSHKNVQDAKNLLNEIYKKTAAKLHTIGCLLPLSGKFSVFGNRALKGVELALIRFSQHSGYPPVNLAIKDTESDPEKAEIAVDELIKEKVSAIIGPMGTAETVSAAKKAQAGGIPIIVLSQKENITDVGNFVFRNFLTSGIQVRSLVEYTMHKKGMSRFAVLYPNENYGKTFASLFISEVKTNGGKVLRSEPYDPDLTDFTDSIKKLASSYRLSPNEAKTNESDFEAIFIPDAPAKAGLIVPQLAYLDLRNIYLLGTNLWHSQKLIDMAEDFLEDWVIITEGFFLENDSEEVRNFAYAFEEKYGEKPGYIEAVSYDTALMMFQTVSIPTIRFPDSVRKELNNIMNYRGVTGLTSFGGSRDAQNKLHILTISDGRFVELDPSTP
jgi:ABC-type branched-subunit amino acid transport system substrate-binding protein/TolA-binding protein